MKRALFIGRFQPFHQGHEKILEIMLADYDEAILVIGSAEESYTERNPFTAGERMEMILKATEEMGVKSRVLPVPIRDINRYDLWVDHVISLTPTFEAVYTNNHLTELLFSAKGFKIVKTGPIRRGDFSGTRIRALMAEGETHWRDLVPKSVASYIDKIDGEKRVRGIYKGE